MFVRLKLEDTRQGLVVPSAVTMARSPGVPRFFCLAGRKRQSKKKQRQ